MGTFEVILFLLGFGAILFLTYVTTKYLAAKAGKALKGRHLNIIETISLGADKKIHLVKAGEKHILVSSTAKSIEFLTELTIDKEEPLSDAEDQAAQNVFDFKALFEKYLNTYKFKKSFTFRTPTPTDIPTNNTEGEKFKVNLEKLKHITQKTNTHIGKDGDEVTDEK